MREDVVNDEFTGAQEAPVFPHLNDLIDPIGGCALQAAATLRLADLIAAGVDRVEPLAVAAGADEDALRRLMRYLCLRGVFSVSATGTFGLNDFSTLLMEGDPSQLRVSLDTDGFAGRFDRVVAEMANVVRTGQPAYAKVFGRSVYDDLTAVPPAGNTFTRLRAKHSAEFAPLVAEACNWSGVRHVNDVGGGTGALLAAVVSRHSHLTGTVIDLPEHEPEALELLRSAGVAGRCTFDGRDFFAPLPAADVHLLSNVLFNWNDDDAVRIMKRCAEAGPAHSSQPSVPSAEGRVLVLERLLFEVSDGYDEDAVMSAALDLRLMAISGGRQRTLADFERLGRRSGMSLASMKDLDRGLVLLEFRPIPRVNE
ncbi:methyltransferase [Sinosporangium siamense]|nr:methyltransferase [Sinosporangium siamense]